MKYVGKGIVGEDEFVKELDSEVTTAKENHKWRWEYMKLFLLQQDAKREGRREGIQEGIQEGRQEGIQVGRREGEVMKVISLTRKKLLKSLSTDEIAEMLEEDEELIRMIADTIEKYPQKSDEEIYEFIQGEKENNV